MSHSIVYQNLSGPVGDCLRPASYSTTARVPISPTTSLVFTTGHIGLNLQDGSLVNDTLEREFEAIFRCLDAALKNAGATAGLNQAYRFTSYLVRSEDEPVMQGVFKKMFPGHCPTWNLVIVKEINVPGMSAEITAEGVIYQE
ncbi:hypothetical protein BDV24DRAFT_159376 [Aspergillus arachidicola]|uniref:YjgF-like protein n=1 Tax=Aspergillus arachidicola TaxID=656916 RepID=A0A2G7G6U3_9EURO|nr:hypothetical protein BDV24DRAFT_159376 [Aspergillus arachidicola]PIG88568.1 hypothetical protein AARAC_000993 [Aspergillus arachidicola]